MTSHRRRAVTPALAILLATPFFVAAQTDAPAAAPSGGATSVAGTLPEVQVTATRYAEPVQVVPYGVSVITAQDIQNAGVSSVSEAIVKLLGVPGTLDTSGGNNYGLDLRGFGPTAVSNQVVVVDGMRLNDDDQSTPNLGAVPISAVQKIEVLRGVGAVQYGEGATGGVIVITTRGGAGLSRKNAAELRAEAGSAGLVDERASAVVNAGDFVFDVAAQDHRTNGGRTNFASENSNLSASGQWRNDWLRLGVRGGNSVLQSRLPGGLSLAQFQTDQTQAATPNDWGSVATTHGAVFAEAALGDWTINLDAGQRSKKSRSWSASLGQYDYNVTGADQTLRARNVQQLGAVENAVVIGLDQSQMTRAMGDSYQPIGTIAQSNSAAWYVSDDVSLPSATRVSLAFRNADERKSNAYNGMQTGANISAWLVGVDQTVAPGWNVYAHTGQSYRLSNIDDLTALNTAIAPLPQVSRDNELGLRWVTSAHQVALRWYRSDVTHEIGYDPILQYNVNFDPTQHQGVELDSRHALSDAVDLRVNLATRSAQFVAGTYNGNNLPQVPQQTAAIGVDLRPAAGHAVNASVRWVSEQKDDFANTCAIPAYTTLDTRYAYTLRNMEFSVAVQNLTDNRYFTQAYGCTAGVTSSIYPEAGRTVSAAIRVSF